MKNSLLRRTLDNVTVVMISFTNFKHAVFGTYTSEKQSNNNNKQQYISNKSEMAVKPPVISKSNIEYNNRSSTQLITNSQSTSGNLANNEGKPDANSKLTAL